MHTTILIVDGSHRLRETLISAMAGDDVQWVEPAEGADALSTISTLRPTLVVLDADASPPGGLELLRRIKADPDARDTSVIVAGLRANDAEVVRALELGASDCLVEPLSPAVRSARVRAVLRQAALFEERLRLLDEKHSLSQEFRAIERYHEALLDNFVDGVVITDGSGLIQRFSLGAQRIFGYAMPDVAGKHIDMLLAGNCSDGSGPCALASRRTIAALAGQRQEFLGARRGGAEFPLELTVREMWDDNGVTYICTARDLTEQKRVEAVLRESGRAAEAANRSKSEFLANMSHELRTPLTAILGFADTLLLDGSAGATESERTEAIHTILRNGEHLTQLINEILDLSKIEAGKMELVPTAYSPFALACEVRSLMAVRAKAKNLSLEIEYVGEIPETIHTDPLRLRQILVNLVGNALKFTEVGGVRLVLRCLRSDSARPMLQIDVIDTGIGMEQEQVGMLFTPFTQVDTSASRRFGGTGLGLTISKRLTEMLGGSITIESSPNKGSVFRVTVETGPLDGVRMCAGPPADMVAAPLRDGQTEQPTPAGKLDCRILLAEDGPDNQRLISFVLRKAGAEVSHAENGVVAFDRATAASAAGRPFDLILMDMQMPVLDGYSATKRLRAWGYGGPIVALTAHAMEGDRSKCIEAGCNDYATKPIDRNALVRLVAHYTRQHAVDKQC